MGLGRRKERKAKKMTRAEFQEARYQYCEKMRASVTSGYRTAKRNAMVGGKPNSLHTRDLAADVVYDDGLPPHGEAQEEARKLGLYAYRGDGYSHDHLRPLNV